MTNDKLRDYSEAFGDLVGSDRVCSFNVVNLEGKRLLTFSGLPKAIEIPERPVQGTEAGAQIPERRQVKAYTGNAVPGNSAQLALGDVLLKRGETRRALACIDSVVWKGDPSGFRALENIHEEEGSRLFDLRLAKKYRALARNQEVRNREVARRNRRKLAMMHRMQSGSDGHLSRRLVEALRLERRMQILSDKIALRRRRRLQTVGIHSSAA